MSLRAIILELINDVFGSIPEPTDFRKLEADCARAVARRPSMYPCDCPDHIPSYSPVNQGRFLTPYESDRNIVEAIEAAKSLKW